MKPLAILLTVVVGLLLACRREGPVAIDTSADACSRCRMAIDQTRHAAEVITQSGDIRKYDSLGCLTADYRESRDGVGPSAKGIYVVDYNTGKWLEARAAHYAFAALPTDHMGYGVAALASRDEAVRLVGGAADKVVGWSDLVTRTAGGTTR